MLTTDLALRLGPVYEKNSKRFYENSDQVVRGFEGEVCERLRRGVDQCDEPGPLRLRLICGKASQLPEGRPLFVRVLAPAVCDLQNYGVQRSKYDAFASGRR